MSTLGYLKVLLLVLCGVIALPWAAAGELNFAPVSGHISSPFGWRTDPMNGTSRFHGGVDIAAPSGMPVYAPQAGVVVFSSYYGGYGNIVVLDHGNSLYTLYGHNSRLLVQAGEAVSRGQMISLVGSTGRSTGPHLHFEVHHNRQYVNPMTYLSYLQETNPTLAYAPRKTESSVQQVASSKTASSRRVIRSPRQRKGHRVVQVVNGSDIRNVHF